MKAIVLAAGRGTRLGSRGIPKCLLAVGDKTVLERQMEILKSAGLGDEDITVVVGHGASPWAKGNIAKVKKTGVHVVLNRDFLVSQSPLSLCLALNHTAKDSLLVMDGDLIFESNVVKLLLGMEGRTAIVVKRQETGGGSRVILNRDAEYGFLLQAIGEEIMSDYVYAGMMRIDDGDYALFLERLNSGQYDNQIFGTVLNDICQQQKIGCVKLYVTRGGGNLLELIDLTGGSYAKTTKIAREDSRVLIRKEAKSDAEAKTIDEITWLLELPEHVKKHFPEVINYNINREPTYFEMPDYDIPTLTTLLLSGEIKARQALEILKQIFDFMFSEIYSKNEAVSSPNFIRETHLMKIYTRLIETKLRVPMLKDIIEAEYIEVNGRVYENILPLIEKINRMTDFLEWISPPRLCMIHGDLHFDNTLIDLKHNHFILVDPKGLKQSDLAYDLGKIWHSCHGMYDFIHNERFSLEREKTSISYILEPCEALREYKEIYQKLPEMILKYELIKLDANWYVRTLFSEAAHFCSVIPFQLKNDGEEKVALGCYATGAQLINEVWAIRSIIGEKIAEGQLVNINTPEDYEQARELFK